MVRGAVLLVALFSAAAAHARDPALNLQPSPAEPELKLGHGNFTLPVIDYQAPDGSLRRGKGIIIGREVAPNATVGVGFFKIKPRYPDSSAAPFAGKSQKVAVGFSLRF